jgi:guanosine-3',5'-bis(diphosphate) 3'-pyrophosphohydrolase
MTDAATLLAALRFSASKHRDQRRKDRNASPYINHPIEVAALLAEVGGVVDTDTLVAAVLHDTIEDTRTLGAEIEASFGKAVRSMVEEVTDNKSLPKAERKRLQIEHAPHLSRPAKLIKLADKIANLQDILHSPPASWPLERRREYLEWTAQVIAGCRGSNEALEKRFDQLLAEGRRVLA